MKQFTVAAVYGGMIGHRCAKAAQQDIARLCGRQGKSCKNQSPPYCPGTGSDHCATSHPHAQNPAYQSPPDDKHPGTACNSPSPRAQSAVLSDVAHSGICECHPGRPATEGSALLSAAAGQPRSAGAAHRDDCGPVPQSPLHLCPQPVFRCDTKIRLRLCRNIHKGYTTPPPACLSRSRTTPQAHTAGHAPESLIQSVS